jgi:hypothetical protein
MGRCRVGLLLISFQSQSIPLKEMLCFRTANVCLYLRERAKERQKDREQRVRQMVKRRDRGTDRPKEIYKDRETNRKKERKKEKQTIREKRVRQIVWERDRQRDSKGEKNIETVVVLVWKNKEKDHLLIPFPIFYISVCLYYLCHE